MSYRSRPEVRAGVAPPGAGSTDVLAGLRTVTAGSHARVEAVLDLTAPQLTVARLGAVVARLASFWIAAEAGLDAWAGRFPGDATELAWAARRRAGLFAADAAALGADVEGAEPLPDVPSTGVALGRLYVLEGSTLGGQVLTRAFAARPASDPIAGVRLRCFTPYGENTGRMWQAYRRAVRAWIDAGGDPRELEQAAERTFDALETWCAPLDRSKRVGVS